MKGKRVERVERRRPMVEISLTGGTRPGSKKVARRGCGRFVGQVIALVAILIGAHLGLR